VGVAREGYPTGMELPLLLIIIGIVLAVLVHYGLGIAVILIGLVLLLWPRLTAGRHTTPTR
jgi:hypothetical protein